MEKDINTVTLLIVYLYSSTSIQDEQVITMSENLKAVLDDDGSVTTTGPYATHVFTFDHVYDQTSTQKKVSMNIRLCFI